MLRIVLNIKATVNFLFFKQTFSIPQKVWTFPLPTPLPARSILNYVGTGREKGITLTVDIV